eukprot:m51a1_g3569 hypothetical protein (354) ;mRNA; f:1092115-1093342
MRTVLLLALAQLAILSLNQIASCAALVSPTSANVAAFCSATTTCGAANAATVAQSAISACSANPVALASAQGLLARLQPLCVTSSTGGYCFPRAAAMAQSLALLKNSSAVVSVIATVLASQCDDKCSQLLWDMATMSFPAGSALYATLILPKIACLKLDNVMCFNDLVVRRKIDLAGSWLNSYAMQNLSTIDDKINPYGAAELICKPCVRKVLGLIKAHKFSIPYEGSSDDAESPLSDMEFNPGQICVVNGTTPCVVKVVRVAISTGLLDLINGGHISDRMVELLSKATLFNAQAGCCSRVLLGLKPSFITPAYRSLAESIFTNVLCNATSESPATGSIIIANLKWTSLEFSS